MDDINRQFDITFITKLFQETQKLSGEKRIAVRIDPSISGGQHYGRGNIIGVTGRQCLIKPLNGGNPIYVEPKLLRLWASRMPPAVIEITKKLQADFAKNPPPPVVEEPKPPPPPISKPVAKPAPGPVPAPVVKKPEPAPVIKEQPVAETPKIEEKEEVTVPVPALQEPIPSTMPNDFLKQLEMFKQLKASLAARAATDGLARLKALHSDLQEANALVETIQREIIAVTVELTEFQVPIPSELQLSNIGRTSVLPAVPPTRTRSNSPAPRNSTPAPVGQPTTSTPPGGGLSEEAAARLARMTSLPPEEEERLDAIAKAQRAQQEEFDATRPAMRDLASKHGLSGSNWCSSKANQYRNQFREYLLKHGNRWMKGRELLNHVADNRSAPSSVLMPLVAEGFLERSGERHDTVYRLNVQTMKEGI